MKKILGIVLIVLIISFGFNFNIKSKSKPVNFENPEDISFNIPEGSSVKTISEILEKNGMIKSGFVFKYKLKKSGYIQELKSGDYNLSTDMNIDQIIEKLVEGPEKNIVKFTIPEGYELRQIADRLSDMKLVNRDRFLELTSDKHNFEDDFEFLKQLKDGQSLEGFLYPATYEVFVNDSEEAIIKRMLSAFNNIYNRDIKENLEFLELDLNGIITLASIVEREGKIDSERPIMAGVFYNRMEKNMKLQSCATVQYILGERKAVLSTQDTRTPSLYNTYLHYGLPPAPIAAPGEKSILAAVNPEKTDYLYFVLTGDDGSHTFTKTFDEHRGARKKSN